MFRLTLQIIYLLGFVIPVNLLASDNWPGFRGPNFNGSSSAVDLPIWISKVNYVKWQTELPGDGSSTPCVWNDAVFITAETYDRSGVMAMKINIWTGQIEWSHQISDAESHDRRSDMAAPSPTTNGEQVIFMSGSGDLVGYDFWGKQLWQRNLQDDFGEFALKWTYSSSPVIFEDSLYVQVLQGGATDTPDASTKQSFLLSIDPKTGKDKWQQIRTDRANGESKDAYTTPTPIVHRERKEILVLGGDCITSHNPKTGAEIWRWGTWNRQRVTDWRNVASPIYGNGVISLCAPKGGAVYTLVAGANRTMNISETRWVSDEPELNCDISSPLFYNKLFFYLNGRAKILTCVDPYTGDIKWTEKIPARSKLEASPSAAEGRIHLISHTGEVFLIKADKEYQLIHSSILGQDVDAKNRSTIVPAKGMLFIRVGKQLWCMN